MKKRVVIIAGPTAVGKTAVAIELAKAFNTVIISADSRQCYREMKIGVARPSDAELHEVPHYFIATHSVQEEVTAVLFEDYALDTLQKQFLLHDLVVVVGGTGLYIKALIEGLDAIPAVSPETRQAVIEGFQQGGTGWLKQQLLDYDELFSAQGEMLNPQRMMRALEVKRSTGNSIIHYQRGNKKLRDFEVILIGLELPRDQLVKRIDLRVDQMMTEGLVAEVQTLLPFSTLRPLNTVGYSEFFAALKGNLTMTQAEEQVRIHTKQYAKRQMTWFRKQPFINWFDPSDLEGMRTFIFAGH